MSRSNYLAAALLAVMVLACGSSPESKPGHSPIEARLICEDFVKDRLKSPGTADFSEQREVGKYPNFISRGAVDSQNTFGGVVRNEYSCAVKYHPGTETWTLEDLTGLDN